MAYQDLEITKDQHVAIVEIQRPPNNFFDTQLINDLADCFEGFDQSHEVRAIVLCSQGKHFCAGNNFGNQQGNQEKVRYPVGKLLHRHMQENLQLKQLIEL